MERELSISLPHLTNEMVSGARKTKLCAYSVALEGWRRGLKLKWYTIDSGHFDHMITFGVNPPGRLFSLSSEERTHYFFRTRGDKVTNEAVEIGSDKDETKIWLSKAGVPVPEGRKFSEEATDDEIVQYASTLEYPLVIKPVNGSLGNGVITNIKNEPVLRKALNYVRSDLEYLEVIVERYVPGEEYRLYVIEDKVIGAYNRLPANIIGDGQHTIEELIHLKNLQRRKNARLFSCLIEIDLETLDFIEDAGYNLNSIPKDGERILLKEKTNVSAGGDPIDVTDELSEEIKQIAINAVKAVPGLYHGGVDIIVDPSKPPEKGAVVIELNPTAQIGGILFPMKGKARDIPAAIIDYYFPETKGVKTDKSKIYFDLNTVLEPLQSRSAMEVEVTPAPVGKFHAKKYIVSGSVQRVSYHQWLKKEALSKDLHGFINNLPDGEIEVVVAGTSKEAVAEFKHTLSNTHKAEVKKVAEEVWKNPVKVGFEINEGFNPFSLRSVESALRKMEKELRRLEKDSRRTAKENLQIEQSTSWKYTAPIRQVGNRIKNIFRQASY
ncbi:acylphosphatase [Halalkalibacterium halodurans]|uniref:acylphosphatase n=1 Tax=Halalkalibacterium halodurans TaxID=86665 RepID=UPI002AA99018|nr:acylphosphatase [Halalkalibacterium halodurans]MDY7224127.1 acylphosphatase [Halalkalibacterium halodurans]MDY7243412.1 acylphosphatase [Halalkalibacterium halodurans]